MLMNGKSCLIPIVEDKNQNFNCYIYILAHLSRMLTGELIG